MFCQVRRRATGDEFLERVFTLGEHPARCMEGDVVTEKVLTHRMSHIKQNSASGMIPVRCLLLWINL